MPVVDFEVESFWSHRSKHLGNTDLESTVCFFACFLIFNLWLWMHSLSYDNLSLALSNLGEHDIEENSGD